MTDQPGAVPTGAGSPPTSERMQALLSRAMEDQASEQRQIQQLLAELRTLLGHLPTEVSEAVAERGHDDALRARVDELASHLGQLGQHIAGLARAVEARFTDDSASLAVVNAVQSSTDNLLARIEPLAQRLDELAVRGTQSDGAPVAEVVARIGALERRIDEVAASLTDTHRRVMGLDNALGQVPEEVRALSERMDSRVAARLDRLDEIAASLVELRGLQGGDDSTVTAELSSIRAGVDALAARPTLAEDRESVVLAVRQLLGETVTAALAESEQRMLNQVGQAFRSANSETERAMRQNLEQALQGSAGSIRQQLLDEVAKATTASEHRVLTHIDAAVIGLAEALLRKKPRRPSPPAPPASTAAPTPAAPMHTPTPGPGAPAGASGGPGPGAQVASQELQQLVTPPPEVHGGRPLSAPHPALEGMVDPDHEVDEPPLPAREAGTGEEEEGRRRRGWFRSGD